MILTVKNTNIIFIPEFRYTFYVYNDTLMENIKVYYNYQICIYNFLMSFNFITNYVGYLWLT